MADDDDYEGEMEGDDYGEEEQMDDLDLEAPEDDAERVQVVEVNGILNLKILYLDYCRNFMKPSLLTKDD